MPVFFIPMFMNMFMNQVYTYKKLFIAEYFRSSSRLSNSMLLGKYCDSWLQVIDQIKMMCGKNDSLSCMVKFKEKFYEEGLCFRIET